VSLPGDVVGGYVFKGGDANDPRNWGEGTVIAFIQRGSPARSNDRIWRPCGFAGISSTAVTASGDINTSTVGKASKKAIAASLLRSMRDDLGLRVGTPRAVTPQPPYRARSVDQFGYTHLLGRRSGTKRTPFELPQKRYTPLPCGNGVYAPFYSVR